MVLHASLMSSSTTVIGDLLPHLSKSLASSSTRLARPSSGSTGSLQSPRMLSRTNLASRAGRSSISSSCAFSTGGRRTLWTGRNLQRETTTRNPASHRPSSTVSLSQKIPRLDVLSRTQQTRSFFGGASQTLLAHRERTANNNPSSATAQNAFYSALLRANMPGIVVERYESGRFASNAFSDENYSKAVQQMGGEAPAVQGQNQFQGQQHSNQDLQALGQAVAGAQGGNVGRAGSYMKNNGKDPRVYVVMEESWGAAIFRWARFFIIFAFSAYVAVTVLSVLVESSGILKRVNNPKKAEAGHQKVKFADVHGCDEAKEELQELVEFLANPERFNSLGGKLPKGVLLVGPPGTGKTLLARAVAGEAGVPYFYMSGSEFDEVYVGVGAKRVRELFAQARTKAPAIIFIDELDAVGAKRNERDAAYVKQTLNQLLTELDGFSQSTGVIILAATNYPELLDKALTRPGRFDRRVEVPLPDVRGRVNILGHYLKSVPASTDVDVTVIARGTPGFSGADLENLVNQAAIRASRNKLAKVGPKDFDWAKDKIIMGAETRSRVMKDEDKLLTAYHEAGHALVAYFSPSAMPLYKITIVPRAMTLGTTHFLPEMDLVSRDYSQYLADIDVSMGGKAAEQLIFGPEKVTSGISADIQNATRVAHMMVTRLGYSQKLGNVDLGSAYSELSSETKQEIEAEVRRIVNESSERASVILKERQKELELLTRALVEYETLTKDEMEKVLKGKKLEKLEAAPKAPVMLPDALLTAGAKPKTTGDAVTKSENPS